MDKVRKEIAAGIGDAENLHRTHLKSLTYLNNVIKESTSEYPSHLERKIKTNSSPSSLSFCSCKSKDLSENYNFSDRWRSGSAITRINPPRDIMCL